MDSFSTLESTGRPLSRNEGKRAKDGAKAFRAVDGEGGNDSNGIHRYYLLRAGDNVLCTGLPLSTYECLSFIINQPKKYLYVGFFFNYDVTMMLTPSAGFPLDKLGELLDPTKRRCRRDGIPFPVRWKEFEIEFVQSKRFVVGLVDPITNKTIKRITIHDCSGFFQCSFLKALNRWEIGTLEDRERIAESKSERSSFTGEVSPKEFKYNKLECDLLELLMEKLRTAAYEGGMRIVNWEGAGQAAAALFSKHNVAEYTGSLPREVKDAAQMAYFGGRFEITGIGKFKNVWQYDINSAYPANIYTLPCLVHGNWKRNSTVLIQAERICVYHIKWTPAKTSMLIGGTPSCAPFPFRSTTGRIYYPLSGEGWYWYPEVIEALKDSRFEIEILEGYEWIQTCEHKPFDFIPDYYQKRKEWGKDGKGIVLKLALNSLYGKTAQSVGRPRFANPVWAGLITSKTRSTILQAISQAPNDILMVATDGIFSQKQLDLPISDKLGEWSVKFYPDMFIVQPGIYFCGGAAEVTKRTRGVPANMIDKEQFEKEWYENQIDGCVKLPNTFFVGIRSGYHMGHIDQIGQWIQQERKINFYPYSKLEPVEGTWRTKDNVRLMPWPICSWQEVSAPYSRDIPIAISNDLEKIWHTDQPDFQDYLSV